MKRFLFWMFALGFLPGFASHSFGGEITWECISSGPHAGKYIFKLTLYRDCRGIPLSNQESLIAHNGMSVSNIPVQLVSKRDLTPQCLIDLGFAVPCDSIQASGGGFRGRVEAAYFLSNPVRLKGKPPITGWHISYSTCCHSQEIDNLSSNGMTLVSTIYPSGHQDSTCFDSSPTFLADPVSIAPIADTVHVWNNAVDSDGDPIQYAYHHPLDDNLWPFSQLAYLPGFSNAQPFGVPSGVAPGTGELTIMQPAQGRYLYGISATSFRHGVKAARVNRTFNVIITTIPGLPQPVEPTVVLDTLSGSIPLVYQGNRHWKAFIAPGDSLNLRMSGHDSTNFPAQLAVLNPYFYGNMVLQDTNFASGFSMTSQPAVIQPAPPAVSMVQNTYSAVDFRWTFDADSCNTLNVFPGLTDSIQLHLGYLVDNCISNRLFGHTITLVPQYNPIPRAMPVTNLQTTSLWNGRSMSWSPPKDTTYGFLGYYLTYQSGGYVQLTDFNYSYTDTVVQYQVPQDDWVDEVTVQVVPRCGLNSDSINTVVVPAGLKDQGLKQLVLFPNPSSDGLLQFVLQSPENVQVFDLTGQLLLHLQAPNGLVQLNVQHWPVGIYIVQVSGYPPQRWTKQ